MEESGSLAYVIDGAVVRFSTNKYDLPRYGVYC